MARRRVLIAMTAVLAAATLGACAPGEDNKSSADDAHKGAKIDVSKLGKVTLNVSAYAQDDQTLQHVAKEFEAKYPNVTVNLVATKGFSDYNTTLKLDLSRPDPPDVALGGSGWSTDAQ